MEDTNEKKALVLTPEEDLAWFVKDFCEWEGFNQALKKIKKVDYRNYVKPKDAPKVLLKLLKRCDYMCAYSGLKWVESWSKCFYCKYARCVREDGSIGHDITINIALHGSFVAG